MSLSERVYDEQIAPLLLQAAKIAEKHRIPFVAAVEWDSENVGSTGAGGGGKTAAMLLTQRAVAANGNIDALVIAVARCEPEDTQSMIVSLIRQGGTS